MGSCKRDKKACERGQGGDKRSSPMSYYTFGENGSAITEPEPYASFSETPTLDTLGTAPPCGPPAPCAPADPASQRGAPPSTPEASWWLEPQTSESPLWAMPTSASGSGQVDPVSSAPAPEAPQPYALPSGARPTSPLTSPSKTAQKSGKFQEDLHQSRASDHGFPGSIRTSMTHDSAELRLQSEPVTSSGSTTSTERLYRATDGDLALGQRSTTTHSDGSSTFEQLDIGTDGIGGRGGGSFLDEQGARHSADAGLRTDGRGVRASQSLSYEGPASRPTSPDPSGPTAERLVNGQQATPDLARLIRDPRNNYQTQTSTSVAFDGGIRVDAKVAGQSPSGEWLVTYKVPVDQKVAAAVTTKITAIDHLAAGGQAAGPALSVSGSLGGSRKVEISGTRAFTTEQEAKDWAASPRLIDLIDLPVTASGASDLRVGERRRLSASISLSASASASSGALAGNAGAGADGTLAIEVAREDDRWTTVTLEGQVSGYLAAALGAPILTVGAQANAAQQIRSLYRFDLSIDQARHSYQSLLLGQLPEPSAGVVGPTLIHLSQNGQSASATTPLGVISSGGQSTNTEIARPDGTRTVIDEGVQVQSFRSSEWLKYLMGDHADTNNARGAAIRTDFDPTGAESDSRIKAVGRVDAQDEERVWNELAMFDKRGGYRSAGDGKSTGGEWRITLLWGRGSLDELVRKVRDEDPEIVRRAPAAYQTFHREIQAAADDREAQRAAVRAYGESGLPARANFQRLLGQDAMERHLEREGCEVWIGVDGWLGEEAESRQAVGRVRSAPDVANSILGSLRLRHLDRLDTLEDWSQYREVPEPLRRDEIARTRAFIERIDQALRQAEDAASHAEARVGERSPVAGSSSVPEAAEGTDDRSALEAAQHAATVARDGADRAYRSVLNTEKHHRIGLRDISGLWWRLAVYEVFGFRFDGPEAENYRQAEAAKEDGEQRRGEGVEAESKGRRAKHRDLSEAATAEYRLATTHLELAEENFVRSRQALRDIERRDK